jgi:uncharacterized tellurite resistance protein B-like protein
MEMGKVFKKESTKNKQFTSVITRALSDKKRQIYLYRFS